MCFFLGNGDDGRCSIKNIFVCVFFQKERYKEKAKTITFPTVYCDPHSQRLWHSLL